MHVTFHKNVEKNDGEGEKRICTLETLCTTIFQPGNNTSMTCYDAYGNIRVQRGCVFREFVFVLPTPFPLPPTFDI